ncbi:helix-turn-helix domain-containing protein [Nocardia sp. CA-128927]|uniref:helix-turn-helix domain-containing protein n=1 Tax=Nocardia sp. CA-128927 TaxID=3239975 RepID=UPI003D973BD2
MNRSALTIAERIELRRRRLGLSRRVVAQLIGRSDEWLRQVEQGHTRLDSIEMTFRLAEVLRFDDPMELVDWHSSSRSTARKVGLELTALSRAIMDHPSTHALTAEASPLPRSLDAVRASLEECWDIWLNSRHRYTELAARLPGVLVAARSIRATAQAAQNGEVEEAGQLLVDVYHLARLLLTRVGDYHLAWLVADRPIGILARTATPTLVAASSWHVASALLSLGYHAESMDYALAASRRLAAESRTDQTSYGALQLVAAEAAAGVGALARSQDLMADAWLLATKLDHAGVDHRIWFGGIEVAITAMNIALQLGKFDDAVKFAANVEIPDSTHVDLRVVYYLTTAYTYSVLGSDFAAIFALQQAELACPEDIRYDWIAHRSLQRLARHDHHLIRRDLAKLLSAAGLT